MQIACHLNVPVIIIVAITFGYIFCIINMLPLHIPFIGARIYLSDNYYLFK